MMADQDMDKLRNEMSELRENLKSVTETVRELASHQGENAYERVREKAASARQHGEDLERRLEEQIESRPLSSVLVVFIGGLITGLLLHGRR